MDWDQIRQALDAGSTVALLVFLLAGFFSGKLLSRRACDREVVMHQQAREVAEAALAEIRAQRDAWQNAHAEEAKARAQAERAANRAIEGNDLSLRLLATLESALHRSS